MSKYNNGNPLDVPENDKERLLAVSEWAEGNKYLQEALNACINNGIPTYASCKGHGIMEDPYISLKVTSENLEHIINIMNNLSKKPGVNILLSFEEMKQGSILTIYPNMINKNKVFDLIATSSGQSLPIDKANNLVQEMLRLHETLRTYGIENFRMSNDIELHTGLVNRNFYLRHDRGTYDYLLDNEISRSPFKRKKDMLGLSVFTLTESRFSRISSKLKNFNRNLISLFVGQKCELIENDEFTKETLKDQERRMITERTIGHKGNDILEQFFDDKDLSNIVTDKTLELEKKLKFSGLQLNEIIKKYRRDVLLDTKLNKNQTLQMANEFFNSIGIDVSELLKKGQSSNENGQKVYLTMNPEVKNNECSSPTYKAEDVHASVIETGTLNDIYALVHEVSHTLYVQNGFNETRMILGEVVPQCVERMLDDYLENLEPSKKEKLGIDDKTLKEDIKRRKISTAIDRFSLSRSVKDEMQPAKKAGYTRYMLAQIYSTNFVKFDKDERKNRLLAFIEALKNNRLKQANEAFDMKIDRNNNQDRLKYVNDAVFDLQQLLLVPSDQETPRSYEPEPNIDKLNDNIR